MEQKYEQSEENKLGEITFRKKLVNQQINGVETIEGEFNCEEIQSILQKRMEKTKNDIKSLIEQGLLVSPYLEIGAERGQRSLIMENELSSKGIAADISFDMLRSAAYYGSVFNKPELPLRVCCDVYDLPFKKNSIPFVFCYETLHHFPDPGPVIEKIYNVVANGGSFFFKEEPFKKVMKLPIKKRKYNSLKKSKNSIINKLLDFFLKNEFNEELFNIVENHNISLSDWKKALSCFDEKELNVKTLRKISFPLKRFFAVKVLIAYLFGGEVSGICKKEGNLSVSYKTVEEVLICPECNHRNRESAIVKADNSFLCSECHTTYPVLDGVIILMRRKLLKSLYPMMVQ